MVARAARKVQLVLLLGTCCIASGCGEPRIEQEPSVAAQRAVAQRFAEAIFEGKAEVTVALLAHPDDAVLASMATQAAAPWKTQHAVVRATGTRSGRGWVFAYAGRHPHSDGRFEDVRGDVVVVVGASAKGARVEYFTFRNEQTRFSTHHDALLPPSSR